MVNTRPTAEPLFRKLERSLREGIVSGEMVPGMRLPTEAQMCTQYSVSRATLRKALDGLEGECLISRARRRGTFVSASLDAQPGRAVIGVVAPDKESGLIRAVVESAEAVFSARGMDTRFYPSDNDRGDTERMLLQAESDGVAGILLYPSYETWYSEAAAHLLAKGMPLCLFDRALRHLATDCVTTDNLAAGRIAATHMISLGHTTISFFTTTALATESVYSRYEGFRGTLLRAGLWEGSARCCFGLDGQGDELDRLASALVGPSSGSSGPVRPTAVVAINESAAMNAVKLILALGLRVPGDVAVISFGSPDMGHRFMVPLTIVEQQFGAMGRIAAQMILDRLARPVDGTCWRMLPPELVVRESCGRGAASLSQGGLKAAAQNV